MWPNIWQDIVLLSLQHSGASNSRLFSIGLSEQISIRQVGSSFTWHKMAEFHATAWPEAGKEGVYAAAKKTRQGNQACAARGTEVVLLKANPMSERIKGNVRSLAPHLQELEKNVVRALALCHAAYPGVLRIPLRRPALDTLLDATSQNHKKKNIILQQVLLHFTPLQSR